MIYDVHRYNHDEDQDEGQDEDLAHIFATDQEKPHRGFSYCCFY